MLADRLSALPPSERDPQHLQVIKMFRDYREKFPSTNSVPHIQDGIARAWFSHPKYINPLIQMGTEFSLNEIGKIGGGKVLEVYDENLAA